MTGEARTAPEPEQPGVRLVLLGEATGAPVCEGDACYLPSSVEDPRSVVLGVGSADHPGAA